MTRGRTTLAAIATAAVAVSLFAVYPLRGERFLAVDPAAFPPWGPLDAAAASRPVDYATTDQLVFMRPNYDHFARSVREDLGGLFWNPGHLCGTPFLATQDTYALYPANFLVFLFGDADVFAATAALHAFIAAFGALLLLRRLGLATASSTFGALAFGVGPWMIARFDYPNLPQAAAWAPWILYAADRAVRDRRARDRALLGSVAALSVYAGMIQLTIVSLFAAGLGSIVGAGAEFRRGGTRAAVAGLLSAAAGVLYGVAWSAPQWLPLFDYAREGARLSADADALRPYLLPPAEWWTWLRPDLFGSPPELMRRALAGVAEGGGAESAEPIARFFGLRTEGATFSECCMAPFAAATTAALAGGWRRPKTFLLGALLIALGGAAASDTVVFDVLHALPGTAFGNPKRWLLLVAIGGAFLAASGADAPRSRGGRVLSAAFPILLFVLGAIAKFFGAAAAARVAASTGATLEGARASLEALGAGLLTSAGFATVAWIGLGRDGGLRTAMLAVALIGEAFLFQTAHNPGVIRRPPTPPTATSAFLTRDARGGEPTPARVARVLGDAEECARLLGGPPTPHLFAANTPTQFRIRDVHGYEGVLNPRIEAVFESLAPGSVRAHHRVETFSDPAVAASPLFDFLGARWFLSQRATPPPGLVSAATFPKERLAIFENVDALPTETSVAFVRIFDDETSLLAALVSPAFDPRVETLLMRSDADRLGIGGKQGVGGRVPATASADAPPVATLRRGSASASFGVPPDPKGGPRLLVSAETFDPGWKWFGASGRELTSVRANHAFQAVLVPPDEATVERVYRPKTWTAALIAAFVGALALGADSRFRRRRRLERPAGDDA